MTRRSPPNKKGPKAAGGGATGTEKVVASSIAARNGDSKTQSPITFNCAFCGELRPESALMGRDKALLFCGRCVAVLEALYYGWPEDALKLFRGL